MIAVLCVVLTLHNLISKKRGRSYERAQLGKSNATKKQEYGLMSEYYTHEEAKTNCPEGSHVAYHRTCEETESPFGWRWCVVTRPPSIVAEPWTPTEPVTLEAAVKIADEWTPGCNRWAAFENMPRAPKHLRWCWHGAKFLALAHENGNPE